ncbi:MAG: twin-arginine translocase TatA/TatE family subunit [Deferribacteraceae bacterium]|jgi:sec-independent protein translocase protein TatA|nr:twin-arginine translocase TatA/TatE family subunit [Deferribacteraceae bacterium]
MGIGSNQILLILLVAALIFGASKLPQIGDGMGKAIRNFKKSVNDVNADVEDITPHKEISNNDKKDS